MTGRPPFIHDMARPLVDGAARYRRRRRWRSTGLLVIVIGAAMVAGMLTLKGNSRRVDFVDVVGPHPTTTTTTGPTTATDPALVSPTEPDPTTTTAQPESIVAKFHAVDIDGLPERYLALGRNGVMSVVDTATGHATELYRIPEPAGDDWRRMSIAADPAGEFIYMGHDSNQDCKGSITRVAVDGSATVDIAEGLDPLVSPDGQWLVYTIDGASSRGEKPPVPSDPSSPCRGRHDSYAWFDLATGTETRWIAPPLEQFQDPVDAYTMTFEPNSHRLYLGFWAVYTSIGVVTPDSPGSGIEPEAFSKAEENFDTSLISNLQFLPDGSVLVTGSLPDVGFPPGYRLYQSPDGYSASPTDVSQPWWLISGYHLDDPGDWTNIHHTWLWNETDEPVLIADDAYVEWLQ